MNTDFIVNMIVSFVPVIFVVTLVVIIGREIVTWYFKLNKVVRLLENIEENTRPKGLVREPLKKSEDLT